MKRTQLFIFILAAAFVFTACNKSGTKTTQEPKPAADICDITKGACGEEKDAKEAQVKKLETKLGSCQKADDCQTVFPSCCGKAKPPYFINKTSAAKFTAEYKKIFVQDCSLPTPCPRIYLGGIEADCISGQCTYKNAE